MNRPTSKLITLFYGACAMASAVTLSSCKDDDDKSVLPDVEIPTEFSDLTVEQNKSNLEDNGITMVTKLTSLQNSAGITTTTSFTHFLDVAGVPEGGRATNNKAVGMMRLLGQFGKGEVNAQRVLKGFRTKEDPISSQEFFDALTGTYNYNKTTLEWDYASGGDKIIFKFPSTETGTTNNAEFSIYGFATKTITNDAAEVEDVPTSLKADLSVGATKQLQFSWAASYKSNGEPTSIVTSLTIGTFKLAYEVVNTTSEIGVDYSLTESGTNILSMGVGAKGNFSTEGLEDSENPEDVATYSNAYFQIVNIKFAGEVKIKELSQALDVANTLAAEATAYNTNIEFVVFYADNKKKIADTEFYVVPESDLEDAHIDIRLIFADGSKGDLETYTEAGFQDLEDKLADFQEGLEEDFGG